MGSAVQALLGRDLLACAGACAVAVALLRCCALPRPSRCASGKEEDEDAPLVGLDGCEVRHRLVAGLPCEQVWARRPEGGGPGAKAAPLVVVVPGMPGIAQVYADFIVAIAAGVGCPAVCVAWCGHHAVPPERTRPAKDGGLGLEEQIAFFTEALRALRAEPEVAEVALVGHSLGAYIAVRALAALDAEPAGGAEVAAVHLFCPVLEEMLRIPRARSLQRPLQAFCKVRGCDAVHALAGLVPTGLGAAWMQLVWWLRGKTSLSAQDRLFWHTVVAHVKLGVLGGATRLALEAMDAICAVGPWLESLRRRGTRVSLHFAAGDRWTPLEVQDRLAGEDRLPGARRFSHRMPHGIVTDRLRARAVGKALAGEIRRDLAP